MEAIHREEKPDNASPTERGPSALLYVPDIRAALGCGQHFAYRLAHELGRKCGRRWAVLPSELAAWLLREREGEQP